MINKILVIEHEHADKDGNIKVRKELIYDIAERLNYLQEALSAAKQIFDFKTCDECRNSFNDENGVKEWITRYFQDPRK